MLLPVCLHPSVLHDCVDSPRHAVRLTLESLDQPESLHVFLTSFSQGRNLPLISPRERQISILFKCGMGADQLFHGNAGCEVVVRRLDLRFLQQLSRNRPSCCNQCLPISLM